MSARRLCTLALLVLAASCESATAPVRPPAPAPGVWHLTLSDGQVPPALVGHRLANGILEQVFADSVQLSVESNGRWTIVSWLETYRDGESYLRSSQTEHGSWGWQDTTYVFSSDEARSRGWMRDPSAAAQTFWLRYVGVDGIAVSTFQRYPSTGDARRQAVRSASLTVPAVRKMNP